MNGPKFQHWVPCGYLKRFAINGEIRGRDSRVFVTDIDGSKDKKVAKVGGARWTYSRSNPALDHEFNDMENDIPLIVDKLSNRMPLSIKERVGFSLIVFDLHHRSAAYENNTTSERFPAYQKVSRQWLIEIWPNDVPADDLHTFFDYFRDGWKLEVMESSSEEKFITSDHPSIIFTDKTDEKPIVAILPISPKQSVVVYDHSRIRISRNIITEDELGVLNGLQVKRCISELYSDHDLFEVEDESVIVKLLTDPRPDRRFEEDSYRPDYYTSDSSGFQRLKFLEFCK